MPDLTLSKFLFCQISPHQLSSSARLYLINMPFLSDFTNQYVFFVIFHLINISFLPHFKLSTFLFLPDLTLSTFLFIQISPYQQAFFATLDRSTFPFCQISPYQHSFIFARFYLINIPLLPDFTLSTFLFFQISPDNIPSFLPDFTLTPFLHFCQISPDQYSSSARFHLINISFLQDLTISIYQSFQISPYHLTFLARSHHIILPFLPDLIMSICLFCCIFFVSCLHSFSTFSSL